MTVMDGLDKATLELIGDYQRRIEARDNSAAESKSADEEPTSAAESKSADVNQDGSPNSAAESKSADFLTTAMRMGATNSAAESKSADIRSSPSMETMVNGWGLAYEDASLLRSPLFEETLAVTCGREFLAEATQGRAKIAVFSGPTGVGKTVAAAWVMLAAKPPGTWTAERGPRLELAAQVARWGAYQFEAERARLATSRMAVVDDLGAESERTLSAFLPYLAELLTIRSSSAGYTVITTNLTVAALVRRYSAVDAGLWERIYDRLRQRAAWFEIDHASLRTR